MSVPRLLSALAGGLLALSALPAAADLFGQESATANLF